MTGRARGWLVLLLAGAFEVGYALSVGGSHGFSVLSWSLVAVLFFLLTLFALSVALRTIDLGIGYAVWAGIGAVGAALLGPVFFDETLTPAKAFWLTVIVTGVVWLKLSDRSRPSPDPAPSAAGSATFDQGNEVPGGALGRVDEGAGDRSA